jgi:uncharacterized spore protein YtfJ
MDEEKNLEDVEYYECDCELLQALDVVPDTMAAFFDTASVDRVYGEPIVKGDLTIIPTAEVLTVMAFGVGFGSGPADESESKEVGSGGGSGGGGKTFARPAAVVVVSPEGVYVEPIIDRTKVLLAAITALGFMVATLFGFLSPKKALKQIKGD